MEQYPKISVIIPVYNTEKYVALCLDAICNNTYQNLEIICVDDGSRDNSGAILDAYAQKEPRLHVIHTPNGGLSAARNNGIDAATGDYITFIDSDDIIHPQYLEILYHILQKEKADIACCEFQRITTYDVAAHAVDLSEISPHTLTGPDSLKMGNIKRCAYCKLFRRDIIGDFRYVPRLPAAEDVFFNILIWGSSSDIKTAYISIPLYFYYQRADSLFHTVESTRKISVIELSLNNAGDPAFTELQRKLYLLEGVKLFLHCRYEEKIMHRWQADQEKYRLCIHEIYRYLRSTSLLCAKDRSVLYLMMVVPFFYRQFRIHDDPTLLQWEAAAKLSLKNSNNHLQ